MSGLLITEYQQTSATRYQPGARLRNPVSLPGLHVGMNERSNAFEVFEAHEDLSRTTLATFPIAKPATWRKLPLVGDLSNELLSAREAAHRWRDDYAAGGGRRERALRSIGQ